MTISGLTKNIPLTATQLDSSNKAILKSLLTNALTFQNQLEDYPSAIETYQELMRRFPESSEVEQALFNLSYCYKKTGNPSKADSLSDQLKKSFAAERFSFPKIDVKLVQLGIHQDQFVRHDVGQPVPERNDVRARGQFAESRAQP